MEKVKSELGSKRKIQADFYEQINLEIIRERLKIGRLEFRKQNDYSLTISFDKNEISAVDVIQNILNHFPLRDMKLEEPTIETVVKEIYQNA